MLEFYGVALEQSPNHMEDYIRPKVDTRRSDQSIFHVTFARDQTNDSVKEESFQQENWPQAGQR